MPQPGHPCQCPKCVYEGVNLTDRRCVQWNEALTRGANQNGQLCVYRFGRLTKMRYNKTRGWQTKKAGRGNEAGIWLNRVVYVWYYGWCRRWADAERKCVCVCMCVRRTEIEKEVNKYGLTRSRAQTVCTYYCDVAHVVDWRVNVDEQQKTEVNRPVWPV